MELRAKGIRVEMRIGPVLTLHRVFWTLTSLEKLAVFMTNSNRKMSKIFHPEFPFLAFRASLLAQTVKSLPAVQEKPGFSPWVGKIPLRRKWQPTPVPLPGKSLAWRTLAGYSPRGRRVGHD